MSDPRETVPAETYEPADPTAGNIAELAELNDTGTDTTPTTDPTAVLDADSPQLTGPDE